MGEKENHGKHFGQVHKVVGDVVEALLYERFKGSYTIHEFSTQDFRDDLPVVGLLFETDGVTVTHIWTKEEIEREKYLCAARAELAAMIKDIPSDL